MDFRWKGNVEESLDVYTDYLAKKVTKLQKLEVKEDETRKTEA